MSSARPANLGAALGLEEYRRRRAELEGRLAALARQEAQLTAGAEQRDGAARLAARAADFCRRVREGLTRADFARKRELVELLIDRVVVTDDLVEIRYVVPTGPAGEQQRFCLLRADRQAPHPLDVGVLGPAAVVPAAERRAEGGRAPHASLPRPLSALAPSRGIHLPPAS